MVGKFGNPFRRPIVRKLADKTAKKNITSISGLKPSVSFASDSSLNTLKQQTVSNSGLTFGRIGEETKTVSRPEFVREKPSFTSKPASGGRALQDILVELMDGTKV